MKKNFFIILLSVFLVVSEAIAQEGNNNASLQVEDPLAAPIPAQETPSAIPPNTDTVPAPTVPENTAQEVPVGRSDGTKAVNLAETIANNINNAKKTYENVWKHGSIMYPEKSISSINAAIRSHQENVPLEILLPALFTAEDKNKATEGQANNTPPPPTDANTQPSVASPAPGAVTNEANAVNKASQKSFYLKSILYFSPDTWTIWLNEQKITSADKDLEVEISNVNRSSIVILWKGANPDLLYPSWHDGFTRLDSGLWSSPNGDVVINDRTGDISFIIHPNQTFLSDGMRIIEGKEGGNSAQSQDSGSNTPGASNAQSSSDIAKPAGQNQVAPTAQTSSPLNNELNSPHMKQYLNQVNMLQSVLGGGKSDGTPAGAQ
ncbi:MAG: hypothetical protein K0R98_1543 [Rickettsiaceae bacterium]|jgi:hypothetical protein|nr:hypothetical protein [Rickettsiaceae bacterium]